MDGKQLKQFIKLSESKLLDRYLSSRGISYDNLTPIQKISYSKSSSFLNWVKTNGARQDVFKEEQVAVESFRPMDEPKYDLSIANRMKQELGKKYTSKELKMAGGIAKDKRYAGGNMTGASKVMDKIRAGLSQTKQAQKALRQANEESEQIDELNKDTLYSYAKKSEKDQGDQFDNIGKGIRDKDPKSANKAGHKFSMRSIGQNRAEKRLAKEAASPAQQAAIAIAMKKDGKEQGVAEGSEWETRHHEFTTVGDRATPEHINKIGKALVGAAQQARSKRGFLNQIVGKQSNGDLARTAHSAETLAKNIHKNSNAKPGSVERKELGQHLVYAVSLLKRKSGEQGVAEGNIAMKKAGLNSESLEIPELQLSELTSNLLARYKTRASADAKAADQAGNYKKGDRRFKGILKATTKQFDNDLKKHNQSDVRKEEIEDWEKEDKSLVTYGKKPKFKTVDPKDSFGSNKPQAAAILSGGKTLTGAPRDTIEIDPIMRLRQGQVDPSKKINKK